MIRNVILRSQQATKNLHLLENFNADPYVRRLTDSG
jgi:hypothetical protein